MGEEEKQKEGIRGCEGVKRGGEGNGFEKRCAEGKEKMKGKGKGRGGEK